MDKVERAQELAATVERLRQRLAMATQTPWELQDGCSWRRIGTQGHDGNVLHPTNSRTDNHPDLGCGRGESLYANLMLIVEAVNALPDLLAVLPNPMSDTRDLGIQEEREACARIADEMAARERAGLGELTAKRDRLASGNAAHMADMIGEAIRARTSTTIKRDTVDGSWTNEDEHALHAEARQLLDKAANEMLAIEPNPSVWVSQNSALRAIIHLIEPARRKGPTDIGALREALERIASGEAFRCQRFAEDDDAEYFLRAQRDVQSFARQALSATPAKGVAHD